MKIYRIFYYLLFVFPIIMGCKKNDTTYGDHTLVNADQALLKINYASAYAANPQVQINLNGKRVSTLITGRTPFPGGGYNTSGDARPDYLVVKPGNVDLTIAIPKKGTNEDSVVLFTKSISVEAGKNYTAHVADTLTSTSLTLSNDDFAWPDSGYAKFRFINLMPNVAAVDLYYGTTVVSSNIAFGTISDYFTMPVPSTTLAWTIRPAGALPSSTALATYSSASTTTNQRSYTAFAMGYQGNTTTTRRPYISFFLVR